MNKLLFELNIPFGISITLIANNHKDLEDYLKENYNFHSIEIKEDIAIIQQERGYEKDYVSLEWVKHI
jgi:hypothetical protein